MAKNEYGVLLDKNGYAPSLMQSDQCCYVCLGITAARHEVYGGPNRQKSKRLGLWLCLCPTHHAIMHAEPRKAQALKREMQRRAMDTYGWTTERFIREIGRNYLEDENE